MGMLEGRKALIFGVANDHSIAWGIAQALHAEGATVGFSSAEMLIDKRVRPLATSLGADFVEPCDVQQDADIDRVFAAWKDRYESLDILIHAVAFAKREELDGRFVDTSREGFSIALDISAYSLVALARADARAEALKQATDQRGRRDPGPAPAPTAARDREKGSPA